MPVPTAARVDESVGDSAAVPNVPDPTATQPRPFGAPPLGLVAPGEVRLGLAGPDVAGEIADVVAP